MRKAPRKGNNGVPVVRALRALGAVGERNAVSAAQLADALGMRAVDVYSTETNGNGSFAHLRRKVREATASGWPVCGTRAGYYLPDTPEAGLRAAEVLSKRAASMLARATRLREEMLAAMSAEA